MNLTSTADITSSYPYVEGSDLFTEAFSAVADNVHCQVLKLETKQIYASYGESIKAAKDGNWDKAIELVAGEHKDDEPIYAQMRERGVDIIRCRPIEKPFNYYLKIEMEHYKFNAQQGERIFVSNLLSTGDLFKNYAQHDFMIFDARLAAVYDYDQEGKLKGGWIVDALDDIVELMKVFTLIKSQSLPFHMAVDGND